eukprot:9123093-Pyramimonas_sp.AAC.1
MRGTRTSYCQSRGPLFHCPLHEWDQFSRAVYEIEYGMFCRERSSTRYRARQSWHHDLCAP